MDFTSQIEQWYYSNKRDLPWRRTKDPYKIWLSEIILQQTRVDQGLNYYLKFVDHYPTVNDLAQASEDEVLKDWQGLGYYSRARNLHFSAKYISEELNGIFPSEYNEILKLKGVGKYTAAAIASFCFNQVHPVIDGNVYRVLSRYFGLDTPIDTSQGQKQFEHLAKELINPKNPADYNQAIMEFGAIQCTPKLANCEQCPLSETCIALQKNMVYDVPVKLKKIKQRDRHFNYAVLRKENTVYLKKRTEKDIWVNLFDFPLVETAVKEDENNYLESEAFKNTITKSSLTVKDVSVEYKHVLSHQKIYATFWELELNSTEDLPSHFIPIHINDIHEYAVPKLIENYIKSKNDFQ